MKINTAQWHSSQALQPILFDKWEHYSRPTDRPFFLPAVRYRPSGNAALLIGSWWPETIHHFHSPVSIPLSPFPCLHSPVSTCFSGSRLRRHHCAVKPFLVSFCAFTIEVSEPDRNVENTNNSSAHIEQLILYCWLIARPKVSWSPGALPLPLHSQLTPNSLPAVTIIKGSFRWNFKSS